MPSLTSPDLSKVPPSDQTAVGAGEEPTIIIVHEEGEPILWVKKTQGGWYRIEILKLQAAAFWSNDFYFRGWDKEAL